MSKGQYDQAISYYDKALDINPGYAEAFRKRGSAYSRKGQYDQAISDYSKAIEINPADEVAYYSRGQTYSLKRQYDQDISDCTKALEINPRSVEAYSNRGNIYIRKGQYDQAISDFAKAFEINPRSTEVFLNRGGAFFKKGQYDQAISDYNKVLEITPEDAAAHNDLAWLLATVEVSGLRNGKRAVELALKACDLSEWKNPNYLDTLAAAYARLGDFGNATKWQEKALQLYEEGKEIEAQERLNLYREHRPWPSD